MLQALFQEKELPFYEAPLYDCCLGHILLEIYFLLNAFTNLLDNQYLS